MTEEEKQKLKELLFKDYNVEELRDLREDCLEIRDSYDLGKCAKRLDQIAEHELINHKCAGAYLYLRAIVERLEWYHSEVEKKLELMKKLETIQ